MIEDEDRPAGPRHTVTANDTGASGTRIDAAVPTIARLVGRWIAREALGQRGAHRDRAVGAA